MFRRREAGYRVYCLCLTPYFGLRPSGAFPGQLAEAAAAAPARLRCPGPGGTNPSSRPSALATLFSVVGSASYSRNQTVPHRWPAFPRGSTRKRSVRIGTVGGRVRAGERQGLPGGGLGGSDSEVRQRQPKSEEEEAASVGVGGGVGGGG